MRRSMTIGSSIVLGIVIVGALLFIFFNDNPKPTAPSQANALPQVVAVINGEAITQDMVASEIKISRLNVLEPLPPLTGEDLSRAVEEAVNQIVTRHLILQEASRQNFVLDTAFIESRADLLFGAYGDEALAEALRQSDATRQDLLWWVEEIFTVEEFTIQVIMAEAAPEARQQAYNDWMNTQRAAADIKTYLNGEEQSLLALVGEPAPDFTLSRLDGRPVSLSDYRGKVVLVNFWATWCPSCVSEMPDYEQVYQYHGQAEGDFVVLGVNLQEGQTHVEQFATGLGLTFPVLLDQDGHVTTRQYQATGMPASFIVDPQGTIFYRHLGPMRSETLQAKLSELGL